MTKLTFAAYDALVEMTTDELLAALLLSSIAAMTLSGIFALVRKRTTDSPPLVGAMVLVACAASVALALGYARLKHTGGGTGYFLFNRRPPTDPSGAPTGPLAKHPFERRGPGPGSFGGPPTHAGSFLSRVVMDAFDLDHDGRLTRDEAAHAMAEILKDGDGLERASIERGDLEMLINRRLRMHEPVNVGGWNPHDVRSTTRSSTGDPIVHSSSRSSPRSG